MTSTVSIDIADIPSPEMDFDVMNSSEKIRAWKHIKETGGTLTDDHLCLPSHAASWFVWSRASEEIIIKRNPLIPADLILSQAYKSYDWHNLSESNKYYVNLVYQRYYTFMKTRFTYLKTGIVPA